MNEWNFSESDGYFYLSKTGGSFEPYPGNGDLGRSAAEQYHRFATAQERSMFVQIHAMKRELAKLQGQLGYVRTVRGANQNLREVRAEKRRLKLEAAATGRTKSTEEI